MWLREMFCFFCFKSGYREDIYGCLWFFLTVVVKEMPDDIIGKYPISTPIALPLSIRHRIHINIHPTDNAHNLLIPPTPPYPFPFPLAIEPPKLPINPRTKPIHLTNLQASPHFHARFGYHLFEPVLEDCQWGVMGGQEVGDCAGD